MAERYAGKETGPDLHGQPLGSYVDGSLEGSVFGLPWAIAPFLDGWAVSDASNDEVRLLRKNEVETVNGRTKENLSVTELGVAFDYPTGLAALGVLKYPDLASSDALYQNRSTPDGEIVLVEIDQRAIEEISPYIRFLKKKLRK